MDSPKFTSPNEVEIPINLNSSSKTPASISKLICFAAFGSLLLVYLLFPTRNYYYDGIFFALVIEEAKGVHGSLIHPNHVVYSVFGFLLYRLSYILGFTVRSLQVLQITNSIASVLSAYVLFRILCETFRSRYLAWSLTLLFALSATWWKYSTDADAYIISLLFLMICFYLSLPNRAPRPWWLVVAFSISVFFHQLAVLFYPVIILGLHWQSSSMQWPGSRRWSVALQFAVGAFVVISAGYCYAFFLAAGTFNASRFARWITSYSPDVSFSFDLLNNLRYTLRGHARLFFGGRLGAIRELWGSVWSVLIIVWIALIGLFIRRLLQGLRKFSWRKGGAKENLRMDQSAKLCALWIAIYVAFLFFWLPHNTFYRLFYLPAIILLIAWFVSKRVQPSTLHRLALVVTIIAIANFLFLILPYSRANKNPPLVLAMKLNKLWPPGTVVYHGGENSDNNLVRYFNPNTEWKVLPGLRQLETDANASYAKGKAVWLETTAIDRILAEPDGVNWLSRHVKPDARHELIDRGHRLQYFQVTP